MKKILIVGSNSYIGISFERWLNQWPNKYIVESFDLRNAKLDKVSFLGFDVIYHLAAIVHIHEKNISKYYEINRDLAYEVAVKAKNEGVKHFIFLSTMGVYGFETGFISKDTIECPKTHYAKSKLEAERLIEKLNCNSFCVSILRPPIVYGKGCKGNYVRLSKIAKMLPIFPKSENERSMIYIDNLSEFVRLIIDSKKDGLFYPQNSKYVNTSELVYLISKSNNKRIILIKGFNSIIKILMKINVNFSKVFGTFVYDQSISNSLELGFDYNIVSFEDSINKSES